MKTTTALFCSAVLLILNANSIPADQLLSNADFSEWRGGKPLRWSKLGNVRVTRSRQSYDSAFTKNSCAVVTCRRPGDGIRQILKLNGSIRYSFSAWVRAAGGGEAVVGVMDQADAILLRRTIKPGDWQKVTGHFQLPASAGVAVIVGASQVDGRLRLAVDNLSVAPLEPDTTPAKVPLPQPTIAMYGYSDGVRKQFEETFETANVITGQTVDVKLIDQLRQQGTVFCQHVNNSTGPDLKTVDDFVNDWSAPFRETFDGRLPGGFDAIAIDELHPSADGEEESRRVVAALAELRRLYPNRYIFAWGMWQLASGSGVGRNAVSDSYDNLLRAAFESTDQFWLECYIREGNPQFYLFRRLANNLESRVPGLLNKTSFGLYISQTEPFIADDSADVDYFEFLDAQFHLIKHDPLLNRSTGVAFWPFYRADPETIRQVNALARHYYVNGEDTHYGRGNWKQRIANPGFESTTAWMLQAGTRGILNTVAMNTEKLPLKRGSVSHGTHCLKMQRGKSPNRARQLLSLPSHRTHRLSAQVSGEGAATLKVVSKDGNRTLARQSATVHSRDEWQRLQVEFPTPVKAGEVSIVLTDDSGKPGQTVFWDFVEIETLAR
ncbi:MAG: hypothetical protein MK102_19425 [Fuerstiella sp.]|nr:hypothetical protein [Fuerstiella sp.]